MSFTEHESNDKLCSRTPPSSCVPGLKPKPTGLVAGHYYRDEWMSNVCRKQDFKTGTSIRTCLQNTEIYFYGDSTGRQWFEYLVENLEKTGTMHLNVTNRKNGPITGYDETSNISVSFQFHGFPFTTGFAKVADIDYVANRLDQLKAGSKPVIFISMWAHFWIFDTTFYRNRLQSVKNAITRLKQRSPGAKIFFKTPNTYTGKGELWGANIWYVVELDRVLREEMANFLDVTVIDVWDMTVGHRTGLNIHPDNLVVEQEVSMLLSFLCSKS